MVKEYAGIKKKSNVIMFRGIYPHGRDVHMSFSVDKLNRDDFRQIVVSLFQAAHAWDKTMWAVVDNRVVQAYVLRTWSHGIKISVTVDGVLLFEKEVARCR